MRSTAEPWNEEQRSHGTNGTAEPWNEWNGGTMERGNTAEPWIEQGAKAISEEKLKLKLALRSCQCKFKFK